MLKFYPKLNLELKAAINKTYYNSPIGTLEIEGGQDFISALHFVNSEGDEISIDYLDYCRNQLDEYFNGKRIDFDLTLAPDSTDFQLRVWKELVKIPFGVTKSYMHVTKRLGDEKAIRAVANANGQNKIPVIIPCHRVIGSDGSLTGYGGGLWRKKWLLNHEKKYYSGESQLEMGF